MDISNTFTVAPAQYDLSRVDFDAITNSGTNKFVRCLIEHKHVFYNWERHYFHACDVEFFVDYDEKSITVADGSTVDDRHYVGCDPDDLHMALAWVFTGDWGPTSVDTIARMEMSGVRVEICGNQHYGPKNAKAFLEELRLDLGLVAK